MPLSLNIAHFGVTLLTAADLAYLQSGVISVHVLISRHRCEVNWAAELSALFHKVPPDVPSDL